MKSAIAAATLGFAGWILVGCGGGGGDSPPPPACPYVNPVCPDAGAPSYKTDVEPILQQRCYACHAPGGQGASKENLTTYTGVRNADIVDVVSSCLMPLGGPVLSVEERTTLLDWNACGGPNN